MLSWKTSWTVESGAGATGRFSGGTRLLGDIADHGRVNLPQARRTAGLVRP
ncbi:hypothetical protein NK6_4278 [Bradyrhizobium diazoefficiens]|uniref:Uncharacterized protein n=1 Tax=Bradyrhizobium diazoefficiens TaxID=1355477 RepID=A0A0E4BPK3_9BRAD|nr:hypothetical protein NK6_4278 [Bradyrhizobium diazoefficiens]